VSDVVTGATAAAYVGVWMQYGAEGVDAERLAADARNAQRGNRVALQNLQLAAGFRSRAFAPSVRQVGVCHRRGPRARRVRRRAGVPARAPTRPRPPGEPELPALTSVGGAVPVHFRLVPTCAEAERLLLAEVGELVAEGVLLALKESA